MVAVRVMLDAIFYTTTALATSSWLALICLPRTPRLVGVIRYGVVAVLCLVYVILAATQVGELSGGFESLDALHRLFSTRAAVLIGWLHYLAFDLFIGVWIALRCDHAGIKRIVQAPVLAFTFLAGPIGLLLFFGVAWRAKITAEDRD